MNYERQHQSLGSKIEKHLRVVEISNISSPTRQESESQLSFLVPYMTDEQRKKYQAVTWSNYNASHYQQLV